MKRPSVGIAIVVTMIGIIVMAIIALTWPSEPPQPLCSGTRPTADAFVTPGNTTVVKVIVTNRWFDGFFIQVWPQGAQPPDIFTSGICYVNGTIGPMPSDNLTLYAGQSATCYFNLTKANGGVPLVKGKTYYLAVYGKSCSIFFQLARASFIAGATS